MKHITRDHFHTDHEVKQNCDVPLLHLCGKKDGNSFGWIDRIVTFLSPFLFCKQTLARR